MNRPKRTFLQIVIDPDKKEKFAEKAKESGKNITDVIMEFVDGYIDESKQIDISQINDRLQKVEEYIYKEREAMVGELAA